MAYEAVCVGFGIFVGVIVLASTVKTIAEFQRGVRFRLGKYHDTIPPGLTMVLPFIDDVRIVDMRTKMLEVPRQDVITRDNALVSVDAVIYYKVVDPVRVILQVENFEMSTTNMAQTTLRSIIGDMILDEVLSKREFINEQLRISLDKSTDKWGVKAENVEIKEISPPADIQKAMGQQMTAERRKRAMILESEGMRQSKILEAEGERQALIERAEGERQSKILRARGEAEALQLVAEAAKNNLQGNALTLWQLNTLKDVGSSPSTKFIFPIEFTDLANKVSDKLGLNLGETIEKKKK